MKRISLMLGILAVALMAYESSADAPENQSGRGPGAGKNRGGQARQAGPGARSPEQMIARMMQEFDKDGDQKLDLAELTAMMTTMRERRGGQGGPGARQGGPGARQGGSGARQGGPGQKQGGPGQKQGGPGQKRGNFGQGQKRGPGAGRRGGEGNDEPAGGKRPKRPDTDNV